MSYPKEKFFSMRNTARMGLCIALICVSAYLAIPVPFMAPLTMQTFVLCLTALILTPRQTAVVVIGYILLGAIGLPVFGGGVGGLGIIFGPRGGFYRVPPRLYTDEFMQGAHAVVCTLCPRGGIYQCDGDLYLCDTVAHAAVWR